MKDLSETTHIEAAKQSNQELEKKKAQVVDLEKARLVEALPQVLLQFQLLLHRKNQEAANRICKGFHCSY